MSVLSQPEENGAGGERFGRYFLLERIGKGGMAEVFRAVAQGVEGFQRVFVIKRILQEKSASREFIDMFISEARVSALLNHPNIVQIYDFGQVDGSYFLSMEYLRGKDLISVMRKLRTTGAQMDPAVAAYIAQQVALALHYAHSMAGPNGQSLDIVHRDVSPSNIMLLRAGGVKLLDFGIARAELGDAPANVSEGKSSIIKGKLSYLSPEQVKGKEIDIRSDIFSLGVCLWEMLTGRRLFYDKTDMDTMKNVMERAIIPPSMKRLDSPTPLDYVAIRALERDRERRYSDAKEMADELDSYLTEINFSASAVPRLLDDLFGEDTGQYEAQMPDVSASGMWPVDTEGSMQPGLSGKSVQPIAVDSTGSGAQPVSPPPSGLSLVHKLAIGGGAAALATAVALFIAIGNTGDPTTSSGAPVAPSPQQTAEQAKATEAVVEKRVAEELAAVLPAEISVRFQTVPRGADVFGPDGKRLGRTPLTFQLARSKDPVEIVVRKKRFVESTHRIIPDRDMSALLTLRLDRKNKRGKKQDPEPEPQLEITPIEPEPPQEPAEVETGTQTSPAEPVEPPPAAENEAPEGLQQLAPEDRPLAPEPEPEAVPEAAKVDPFEEDQAADPAP